MDSPHNAPVIDASVLEMLKLLGGDDEPQLFVELIDLFITDAKQLVDALQRALETGDVKLLERTAHTLKSSCANVGAMQMSKLCFELEQLGRAAKLDGAQELVNQALAQYERVELALTAEKCR